MLEFPQRSGQSAYVHWVENRFSNSAGLICPSVECLAERIVERLDVVEHIFAGQVARRIARLYVNALLFEAGKEALYRRVIPAAALPLMLQEMP